MVGSVGHVCGQLKVVGTYVVGKCSWYCMLLIKAVGTWWVKFMTYMYISW